MNLESARQPHGTANNRSGPTRIEVWRTVVVSPGGPSAGYTISAYPRGDYFPRQDLYADYTLEGIEAFLRRSNNTPSTHTRTL